MKSKTDPAKPAADAPDQPIRAAATVVLTRRTANGHQVLMGQRGASAAFMPSKYVFPGGAVDAGDLHPGALPLSPDCARRLSGFAAPASLAAAALRELAEETGLRLRGGPAALRFVFRAITPPGRTRRFDACFFLADAADVLGDPDDFAQAEDELSHLHWIGLAEARALDLPFVTEVVLAEVTNILQGGTQPGVPFFDNSGPVPTFRRID